MTNYPLLDLFLTMLYFFLWILWIMILFWIILDIFRSDDLGGWGKAGWLIFVIFLPLIGILTYLIVRGHSMADRQARQAQAQEQATRAYIQDVAGSGTSQAEELTKLKGLHDQGVLSDQEFEAAKAKVLAA